MSGKKGSHVVLRKEDKGCVIPLHKELAIGTLLSAIKQAKITAEIFGEIKNFLKKSGTPIPINDVWIASHTVETGSVVITYDNHFKKVPGLRCWGEL